MKIRQGFVSNSSTTSYTCDICGNSESGWDSQSMEDFGFFKCENGHFVCLAHMLEPDRDPTVDEMRERLIWYLEKPWSEEVRKDLEFLKTASNEDLEEWLYTEGDGYWSDYTCEHGDPEWHCPICQFLDVSSSDTAKYLLAVTGVSRDEVFAKVKAANRRRRKLYDHEYVAIVCLDMGIDIVEHMANLKERFGTYRKFQEWLHENT